MKKIFLILILFLFVGCTTVQKSAGIGAALGAGTGALIGHNSHAGSGTGALIGAAIGGLSGALIGDQIEENEKQNNYPPLSYPPQNP
jgi:outer membrane lipoprotein SlyB